jgi:hypothetical protein
VTSIPEMDMPVMTPTSPVSTAGEQITKAIYGAKTTTRPLVSRTTVDFNFELVLAGFSANMYSVAVLPSKSAILSARTRQQLSKRGTTTPILETYNLQMDRGGGPNSRPSAPSLYSNASASTSLELYTARARTCISCLSFTPYTSLFTLYIQMKLAGLGPALTLARDTRAAHLVAFAKWSIPPAPPLPPAPVPAACTLP